MAPNEKSEQNSQIIPDDKKIDSQVHLDTNKRVIFWLYLFSIFLFPLLMFIFLGRGWQLMQDFRQSDSFFYSNQIAYQWKLGFITDIQITNETSCPTGYQSAFEFKWPGSNYGCYCEASNNASVVISGQCNPSLIEKQCRNIERKQKFTSSNWKNSSNFCIKRSSTSFFTQQKYNGQNIICGLSNSLTIMPANSPCPYVNISTNQSTLEDNQQAIQITNNVYDTNLYAIFNATSPYSFYMYPISQFVVSEYEFCLINDDTGINPDHNDFILLSKRRGCAEKGNFTTIDTINEEEFYNSNSKLNELTNIEGFPSPQYFDYHLGFSNVPSWKYQCRHNMDNKFKISIASDHLNFVFYSNYRGIGISIFVLLSLILVEFIVIVFRRLYHQEIYPVGYKQVYLVKDFFKALSRYIFDLACKLAIFGMFFYLLWFSLQNWNWFNSAINQNCAQSNPQIYEYSLSPFQNLYNQIVYYCLAQFIFCSLFIILDTIHFVYIYKKQLVFYLVSSEGKQLLVKEEEQQSNHGINDLDLDFIKNPKWVQINEKEHEKQKFDDFRVTMAMKLNNNNSQANLVMEEEEIITKPKTKKKKKGNAIKHLFNKKADQAEQKKQDKKMEDNLDDLMDDTDPYILEQKTKELAIFDFQVQKKERKRR